MTKLKKAPTFKYGIEITKPHSKEMYAHNDAIALEMKRNIISEIHLAYSQEMGTEEATNKDNGRLHKIASTFTGYQFGDEYDFDGMKDEAINTLANIANWQMHEEYSYLCFEGIVPRTRFMMVGFDWEKHDYSYCTDIDLSPIAVMEEQLDEIQIPCSAKLDQEMANESENIQ